MGDLLSGLWDGFKTVLDFTEKNKFATALGLTFAGGMFSPDELDVLKYQDKLKRRREETDRRRWNKNMEVGKINMDFSQAGNFLEQSGTPYKPLNIIQSQMRRV